jgi:AcrR family transcriptional regulator
MNLIQYMTHVHKPASPTRQRRQREAGQRRKSILDAARQVFWKQGYTGATMPGIAAAAELAPGTLYLYFPSKDALYAELLAEGYEIMQRRLEAARAQAAAPRRQAAALIDAFFAFATEFPQYFDAMFFVLQREGGSRESRLAPEQVQRLKAAEQRCQGIAADVLQSASVPAARRAADSIEAIWSMLAGVIFYFRNDPRFAGVSAEARRLVLAAVFDDA